MGEYEDLVREAIKQKYGSVPKMSEATGIPTNTIYHALERGLHNTRTETSRRIKESLFDWENPNSVDNLSPVERELIDCFRDADDKGKSIIIATARAARSEAE